VTPTGVYIAIGSNLGDRAANLHGALDALRACEDIDVVRCSSIDETAPVGGPAGQGMYLNAVAELDTTLEPRSLLRRLLEIEDRFGRVRSVVNGPRTLDLDLILYRSLRIDEPDLIVPHPRIWEREFVMRPLRELCGVERTSAWRDHFGSPLQASGHAY